MDLDALTKEIDSFFGFISPYTFNDGQGSEYFEGVINVDESQLRQILQAASLPDSDLELLAFFVIAHEKGHAVQDQVSPNRNYDVEKMAMEIEADLFGAWALNKKYGAKINPSLKVATRQFNDINRIAKDVGGVLGGKKTHSLTAVYPWAPQRESAIARGAILAANHSHEAVKKDLGAFAYDVKRTAAPMVYGR